jgi:3',5'-cyclic AMP phosphodiesterase CpdA
MRRLLCTILLLAATAGLLGGQGLGLPNAPGSLRFAVIGDMGTGERPQFEVAEQMVALRANVNYDLVLMVGDNLYGRQRPEDILAKFDRPYAALLATGVLFYGVLGNHDDPNTRFYKPFNMNGERYYTFTRDRVRFFMLDTNVMDRKQLAWAEAALQQATEPWRIAIFHHPLYSNAGRHGSDIQLRTVLEPMLVKAGVQVVFSGHDHVYERIAPQQGVTYFVTGSGGKLSAGDVRRAGNTAAAFDSDRAFAIVEIAGDTLYFQAISRTGAVVDAGVIQRRRPTT